ncbi:MAG: hypothetical protein LBQ05_00445, partial [Christensenellaceae bacterium]|nr:hypothetical protein [Christensenellaceae bacterium]
TDILQKPFKKWREIDNEEFDCPFLPTQEYFNIREAVNKKTQKELSGLGNGNKIIPFEYI